jgi:hypothetical protein
MGSVGRAHRFPRFFKKDGEFVAGYEGILRNHWTTIPGQKEIERIEQLALIFWQLIDPNDLLHWRINRLLRGAPRIWLNPPWLSLCCRLDHKRRRLNPLSHRPQHITVAALVMGGVPAESED